MNTNDTLHFDTVRIGRFVETAVYAGLAAGLIGQVFALQGPITPQDAGLVMLGVVFGLIAACGGAPLVSLLTRRGAQASRQTGDVLAFSPREPRDPSSNDGISRRAA